MENKCGGAIWMAWIKAWKPRMVSRSDTWQANVQEKCEIKIKEKENEK